MGRDCPPVRSIDCGPRRLEGAFTYTEFTMRAHGYVLSSTVAVRVRSSPETIVLFIAQQLHIVRRSYLSFGSVYVAMYNGYASVTCK